MPTELSDDADSRRAQVQRHLIKRKKANMITNLKLHLGNQVVDTAFESYIKKKVRSKSPQASSSRSLTPNAKQRRGHSQEERQHSHGHKRKPKHNSSQALLKSRLTRIKSGQAFKYQSGFQFRLANIEISRIKDLNVFVSETNPFPNVANNDKQFFNRNEFVFHTSLRANE